MPESFVHDLRVRFGECDMQGIVFNPNYLAYFDVAITELWREAVCPWDRMVDRGVDMVLAEVGVRFRAPARFDDLVQLRAQVARLGTTSLSIAVAVERDGEVLVEGDLRYVMVDAEGMRKTPIPDWVADGLMRFAAPAAAS